MLQRWLSFWKVLLCVLGHLPDQGPSPPIAQFDCADSSRKSLGDSKLLKFKKDGGHFVLWDLNGTFLCLNTILSWSSTDNSFDLMAWFML